MTRLALSSQTPCVLSVSVTWLTWLCRMCRIILSHVWYSAETMTNWQCWTHSFRQPYDHHKLNFVVFADAQISASWCQNAITVGKLELKAPEYILFRGSWRIFSDASVTIAQWRRARNSTNVGYPQVPGSIPAENMSTQINMDLSK